MIERFITPDVLHKEQLDQLLEHGWFRMNQSLFTTHFLDFDDKIYRAIWLRIDLKDYQESSSYIKLKKRNKHLEVIFRPLDLHMDLEVLFSKYAMSVPFPMSLTPDDLLLKWPHPEKNIFDTLQVELWDGDEMVGGSFFDLGMNSAQGICAFYDPAYASKSLGRYLIYLQIAYCRQSGMEWYYPGYFVPHYPALDYKLNIGRRSLSFLDPDSMQWKPIATYCDLPIPIEIHDWL